MAHARLLIIEDDQDIRRLLNDYLGTVGFETRCLSDGTDWLKAAGEFKPDLLVLDLALPTIDGWAIARELRRTPGFESLPILALTAHTMPGDPQKAIAAGCNDYLAKPFDPEMLLQRIQLLLNPRKS
jgi:two-component system cell cycle response regulator DivK